MINWIACLVLICLISIAGLIWYFVNYMGMNHSQNYKDEVEYLKEQLGIAMGNTDDQPNAIHSAYISGIVDSIRSSIEGLQLPQIVFTLSLNFAFFVLINIWFVEYPFSYSFNMLFGTLSICVFSHYATQTIGKSLTRTLIAALNNKEQCFTSVYNAGFALGTLLFALQFAIFIPLYYFDVGVWCKEMAAEDMKKLSVLIMGYLMGVLLASMIFRESISILCRSLKTASFGLIKSDLNLNSNNNNISQLTREIYIVSQQAGQVVVNFIDTGIIIIFLIATGITLYLNSEEIIASPNKQSQLLFPLLWICMSFVGVIVCYFMKIMFQDKETGSFAALNIRWQVIIAAIVAFLVFIIFTPFSVVDKFTIKGASSELINQEAKTKVDSVWCCILGLLFNVLHISIYEWYTSHGCPNVRNMSLASSDRILSMNSIYANYLGDLFAGIPLITFFLLILIVYGLQGFAGILLATSGYISLFLIYAVIYFIGASSSDSYKLTCFAPFLNSVQIKVFQIYWETRNYMIFLKITNAGASIMISLVLIGALAYQNSVASVMTQFGIFGLLIGVSLPYIIKGINTWAIINLAKDYFIIPSSEQQVNYRTDVRILEYVKQKYTQSVFYVLQNFAVQTILIFIIGDIFGIEATMGILLGAILSSMIIQFSGLIKGPALENARIYNEIQEERKDRIYLMYVSAEVQGYATEETNATPLIVYLVYLCCLVASCHTKLDHKSFFEKKAS